jgi:three-Cys-motif partner protein
MPLPDDSLEKWKYKEHTQVKHEILSKYLNGWIRILGSNHNKVCYFDCFAGRGEYEDESKAMPGSPLIALETARRVKEKYLYIREIVCFFIEKNKNNLENLKVVVNEEINAQPEKYDGITIIPPINDEFANVAHEIINQVGDRLAPSFFFIDPFGFSGVPFEIIKKILAFERTEVLITFMVRDAKRFLGSSRHRRSIEELYGMQNVRGILNTDYGGLPIEQALLKLYRDQLHVDANVKYTLPFKVNADERLQTTYYLIHATNSQKGCELMKEIMYKTGTEARFGYLGPAEGQMSLTQYDGLSKLEEFLLVRFSGRTVSYQNVRYETLMDTDFVRKHYHDAILDLEEEDKIQIAGKGPRGGLLDNALITFPQ